MQPHGAQMISVRDQEMVLARDGGDSTVELGERYGISHQRVSVVLAVDSAGFVAPASQRARRALPRSGRLRPAAWRISSAHSRNTWSGTPVSRTAAAISVD